MSDDVLDPIGESYASPPSTVDATELPPPDGAEVAATYRLGTPDGRPSLAARGELGRIWALTTDIGRWAVKELFEPMAEEDATADVAFQEAVAAAGVPMPAPRRRPGGSVLANIRRGASEATVRVYSWVDLRPGSASPEAAGALLATIHRVDVAAVGPAHPWFTQPTLPSAWEALRDRIRDLRPPWAAAFEAVLPQLLEGQELLANIAWVPDRWCHLDFNPQNVLRDATGQVVVIDWENAGPGHPDQELAMSVLDFGLNDDDVAGRFVSAYRRAGGPGRLLDRESFGMALAVFGHLSERYGRRALDPDVSLQDRERSAFWLNDMLAAPITLPRIDRLLSALRR
jgi:aminoglycoside phosphotransferase (APT) family kinase protein